MREVLRDINLPMVFTMSGGAWRLTVCSVLLTSELCTTPSLIECYWTWKKTIVSFCHQKMKFSTPPEIRDVLADHLWSRSSYVRYLRWMNQRESFGTVNEVDPKEEKGWLLLVEDVVEVCVNYLQQNKTNSRAKKRSRNKIYEKLMTNSLLRWFGVYPSTLSTLLICVGGHTR